MTTRIPDLLTITPETAVTPEIGALLGMAQEARGRLLQALDALEPAALAWQPPAGNSIGALLYHVAVIEADWLYVEVLETDFPPDVAALFAAGVRSADGKLVTVAGHTIDDHLARLAAVRARLLAAYAAMSAADFRRPRQLPQYHVTPEWVLNHLLQHEAEHRGQLLLIRELWAAAA